MTDRKNDLEEMAARMQAQMKNIVDQNKKLKYWAAGVGACVLLGVWVISKYMPGWFFDS